MVGGVNRLTKKDPRTIKSDNEDDYVYEVEMIHYLTFDKKWLWVYGVDRLSTKSGKLYTPSQKTTTNVMSVTDFTDSLMWEDLRDDGMG